MAGKIPGTIHMTIYGTYKDDGCTIKIVDTIDNTRKQYLNEVFFITRDNDFLCPYDSTCFSCYSCRSTNPTIYKLCNSKLPSTEIAKTVATLIYSQFPELSI